MKRPLILLIFRIVLLYLLFGGLWIAVSDRILEMFVTDTHRLTMLQTWKGWIFVAVSSLLLYIALRHEFRIRERVESAQRVSEEKYRLLMQHANDGIVIADAETGIILEVNGKIEELTGRHADELIGTHHSGLYPQRDAEGCRKLFATALVEDHVLTNDLCLVRREGQDVPVEISASVVDIDGRKLIQGIFRDVSLRKAAECAIRTEKTRAEQYLDVAGVIIRVVDDAGNVVLINRRGKELLGLPEEEIVGKNWIDNFVPERIRDEIRSLFTRLMAGEPLPVDYFEYPIIAEGGEERMIAWYNSFLRDDEGRITAILSSGEDITARKKAEAAIRVEKSRAEQYLDIAGAVIMVIHADENVALINKKGREILGADEEDIIGKNFFDNFIPVRLRDEARSIFARLMADQNGALKYFEFPVVTRSGRERILTWHNTLIRSEQGTITGCLSSGQDITEQKKAEEQARSRLGHLATLHSIDMIINSSLDLTVTLNEFLNLVTTQLQVDAAAVLLFDPYAQVLQYAAMRGFRNENIRQSRLRLGEGVAGRAALERRMIGIPDLRADDGQFKRMPLIEGEDFVSYYAMPLISKGRVKGVLDILHRTLLDRDQEWVDFFMSLAAQAAIAIDNAELFSDLQRSNAELILAYDTTIEGWARALELRDQETEGHTQRTAEVTVRLARAMGMEGPDLVHVRRGALLHDIGKMSIPDTILLKEGPLTDEEWRIMRLHPVYAFEMLSPISYLRPALDIPYCHHERWDGTGYPRGLKGERIPLSARIFSLADIWDALTSARRYHDAWPEERVREHIRSLAGSHFDPHVVRTFLNMEHAPKETVKA